MSISFVTLLIPLVILLLLLALLYLIYLPPVWLMNIISSRYPSILFHLPTGKPILALTVDDSPSGNTSTILEVLRAHDIHATFFVIGTYIDGREDVLRDLVVHGNELANHTMHDEPSWKLSMADLKDQVADTRRKLQNIYDSVALPRQTNMPISKPASSSPPLYFRPGSGFFTASMLTLLESLLHRLVLGSIYPHDAQISIPWLNAWHVLRGARPGGIIICHDRPWTPEMLRSILPELKRRGFRIGSLTEALGWADGKPGEQRSSR